MSSFFDDFFKKVFKPSGEAPLRVKENFTVKEAERSDLDAWLQLEESEQLLSLIYKNYHFKRSGIDAQPQVFIFESPYANGFAVTYDEPFDLQSFSRIFLAFSQRIIDLGI
jgi:hypothetical protein